MSVLVQSMWKAFLPTLISAFLLKQLINKIYF